MVRGGLIDWSTYINLVNDGSVGKYRPISTRLSHDARNLKFGNISRTLQDCDIKSSAYVPSNVAM